MLSEEVIGQSGPLWGTMSMYLAQPVPNHVLLQVGVKMVGKDGSLKEMQGSFLELIPLSSILPSLQKNSLQEKHRQSSPEPFLLTELRSLCTW